MLQIIHLGEAATAGQVSQVTNKAVFFICIILYINISFHFIEFKLKFLKLLTLIEDNGHRKRLNIVEALAPKWKDLGDYLDINSDFLVILESRHRGDLLECCREVMKTWIEQRESVSYSPTWEGLYTLLKDLRRDDVANDLMKAIPGLDVQHH